MNSGQVSRFFDRGNLVRSAVYLLASCVVLYPMLVSPVVADDFVNPFGQIASGGPGLEPALDYGWRGATEGASFRIVGNPVGSAYNWMWIAASARLDIGMTSIYAVTKFVVFVLCAMSIARLWFVASRAYSTGISYWNALIAVSVVLFSTLQLHAQWSNDPTGSYPLSGFGSAALGFLVLASSVDVARLQRWRPAVAAAAIGAVAVGYYEINVGAVLGAGMILLLGIRTTWNTGVGRLRSVLISALVVAAPAVLVLLGRTVTGETAESYGGTTVRLGGAAASTFATGMLGSMPGAAWRLSARMLGGSIGLVFLGIAIALAIVLLVRWWMATSKDDDLQLSAPTTADSRSGAGSRAATLAVGGAVVVYWTFSVALQSITIKVQDEMIGVGYVYTFYAMGACCVALALAVAGRRFHRRIDAAGYRFVVGAGLAIFLLVQLTINWRLSEQLNEAVVPNRQLLAAFDGDVDPPQRCQALMQWSSGGWPDYYEVGMIDGLQTAYEHYFDEPFCDGFVRPPG